MSGELTREGQPVSDQCRQGRVSAFPLLFIGASMLVARPAAAEDELAQGAGSTNEAPLPKKEGAAGSSSNDWLPLGLQSYEPSAFGYTNFSDDVGFYNIKVSVKFPLAPGLTAKLDNWSGKKDHFYFSFTGLFGFYIGTRDSNPVVGKEYNPQFFWQRDVECAGDHFTSKHSYAVSRADSPCYFSLGYNHDSNGQIIAFPDQYLETQRTQGTEAADDAISRGWDYLGFRAKYIPISTDFYRVSLYPDLKYFLSNGIVQGPPEELHYWEHPSDGKPRKEVDGVAALIKYQCHFGKKVFGDNDVIGDGKAAIRYDTGYQNPFKYSTWRIEGGVQVFELPIVFWAQKGYMSDLSQYYRNVTGYGVEIEIGAF